MAIKKMRDLYSAVSALKRVEKFLPTLARSSVADTDALESVRNAITKQGEETLKEEVGNMFTPEVLKNAASIAYYVRKLGIK